MEEIELIENGFLRIVNLPHPQGGDYTKLHFVDKNGNYVKEEEAAMIFLKAYKFGEEKPVYECYACNEKARLDYEEKN